MLLLAGAVVVVVVLGYLFIYVPLQKTTLNEKTPENVASSTIEETRIPTRAPVVGTPLHPAEGYVRIVRDGEKTYLRYEDFKTINGPDLFVYLANDLNARDFVTLGSLKATEGNINYEVPVEADVTQYHYALVWCRAFGVLFNSADLSELR